MPGNHIDLVVLDRALKPGIGLSNKAFPQASAIAWTSSSFEPSFRATWKPWRFSSMKHRYDNQTRSG